ncbi:J domain-containing protein [Pseudoclavibacter chungangensis]|uniref:J domain-containing protein n=1 Tax=Pseudoclavibacter chungangensis TaxID=587635 RepID=A0A7J5BQ51_9MICO|nr:J domain-containing protein [Pseudoclavibacter chungangensis]KAB1655662.1 J domain-containing protein [Pseudoclavibacter chungangensis]NYJ67930.1 hypothetical protein [Pseudoclavibacter chungangensis]
MSRPQVFTEDLYAVLGVPQGASEDELRRAGRSRQRETHPDYGGDAADFVKVRLALEVLTDPQLRAQHDEWLAGSRTARRSGSRLRAQQRTPRRPAPRTPAGARTPTATPQYTAEPPPPDRIPKPRIDLDRMAWARTAWAPRPTQWPPATAALPPLAPRELALVVGYALVLVIGTLLFVLPSALVGPPADGRTGVLYVGVVCFLLLSLGWAVPCVLVRARALSRVLNIVSVVVAGFVAVVYGVIALIAVTVGQGGPALAAFLGFVVCLLTALLSVLVWTGLAGRARAFLQEVLLVRLANASAPRVDDPTRVFGAPAQSTMGGTTGISPSVNPMRAVMAQRIVGPALAELLRIPGVRIVHGLRAPGGAPGVVAHAVVAGRRIAFIDDELWLPGTYSIGQDGGIRRDGEAIRTAATEFPHAVEAYHRLFGEVALVRGWITIVPERDGPLDVDGGLTWERARLATLESMLREVGDWLAQDGERVDRLLLRDLLRHRA